MTTPTTALWLLILLICFLSTFIPTQETRIIQSPMDQLDEQVDKFENQ